MPSYDLTVHPDAETEEYRAVLRGTGNEAGGRGYVFRNPDRCATFAEAVNFAYRQGLRDGRRQGAEAGGEALLVVIGSTPDDLEVRRESGWGRLRRRVTAGFNSAKLR